MSGSIQDRKCGTRQLRGSLRKKIGAELCYSEESVDVYNTNRKRKLYEHGDLKCGTDYSDVAMRQAKSEYVKSRYFDMDPIKSIQIMKRNSVGKNIIRDISNDPFKVFIFSQHQIRLWNNVVNEVPLIIDSTTGIAKKLDIFRGEKSHTLGLHLGVVNCKWGQLSVLEGITERQDTVTISTLLQRFIQAGARYPKQTVSVLFIFISR